MIEDQLAELREQNATILRELRELRLERQHQAGHWGSRAEAASHHAVSIDTVDAWIRAGTIRAERRGPEPALKRDSRGRRIDRRRVLVWIAGPPKTAAEIARMATEAQTAGAGGAFSRRTSPEGTAEAR